MNAGRLLALYEKVAEAPDAIERLRRFVLDLAVRGKLVEQDPADEPASELMKRIGMEKKRLGVKHPTSPLNEDEVSFELPAGWCWTRIGEICSKTGSGSTPRGGRDVYKKSGVSFLRSQNVYNDGLRLDEVVFIDRQTHERMKGTRVLSGDLLLNITGGSTGRCGIVPADFAEANISQHVAIIRPVIGGMESFLHGLILSPYFQAFIFDEQTGAGRGGLPKNRMDRIAVALPPLAEQRRIVAKVEELMALLDRLETARIARETTRDQLTASSFTRLTAPGTTAEDFPVHARFAFDALPALTARPDQIKTIRQTILNLAVRGRLVEQDPADEPASELLERIAKRKVDRRRETGDARIKIAPDPNPTALPMEVPDGWGVQSFENLFLFIDYRGKTPSKTDAGIALITAKNIRMGSLNREPREYVSNATYRGWMTRGFPEIGDLLFTTEAPLANVCLNDIDEPFALAQRVICLKPFEKVDTKFLMFAIMSDIMQSLIEAHSTGLTAKGIKAAKLKPLPLPIPPLAEQHRIVVKVDTLMALCDRLEVALTEASTTRTHLLEALVHQALSLVSEEETESAYRELVARAQELGIGYS